LLVGVAEQLVHFSFTRIQLERALQVGQAFARSPISHQKLAQPVVRLEIPRLAVNHLT